MNEMERLWKNVRGFFEVQSLGRYEKLIESLPAPVEKLLDRLIARIDKQTNESAEIMADWVGKLFPVSPELAAHFKDIKDLPPPVDIMVMGAVVSSIFTGYMSTWIGAQIERGQWKAREDTRPTLPDIGTIAAVAWKEPEKWDKIKQYMGFAGFEEDAQKVLVAAGRQFESSGEIISLLNRGEIDYNEALSRLGRNGYAETEAVNVLKLRWVIPPIPDLVRFSVREAYYEDYVKRYGLDQEFPNELAWYSAQQGVSLEFAKYYWRSHWELPSLQMGFEMLHRGVIEEEDLDNLFIAQDIMPWWRDKIKKISFVPFTRVDVRRMYREGVLGRDEVTRAYRDIGYDEYRAAKMTDFVIAWAGAGRKKQTQSQIIRAYDWDVVTHNEAVSLLLALGYSEETAENILTVHDYEEAEKAHTAIIAVVEARYKRREIDTNAVYAKFGELGITGKRTADILERWDAERVLEEPQPSKADLIRWFKKDILTESIFKTEMSKLGYSPQNIYRYILDVKGGR